jgi:hypothetical protein
MKTKSLGWDVVSRLVIFLLTLAGGGEVFAQTGSDYWQYNPQGQQMTSYGFFTLNFENNTVRQNSSGGSTYSFAYLQIAPRPAGGYVQNINGYYYIKNTPWVPPQLTMSYSVTNNSGYAKNFFVKKNNTIIASGSVPTGGPHSFGPYNAVGMDVFQFWNQDSNQLMADNQITTSSQSASLTIQPAENQVEFNLSIDNRTGQAVPIMVLFSGVGLIQQSAPPGVSQIQTFGEFSENLIQVMEAFTDPQGWTEIARSQFGVTGGLNMNAIIQGTLVPDDGFFGDDFPVTVPPRILDNSDLPPTLFTPGETVVSPTLTPDPKPDRSALYNPTTENMTKNDFYDIIFEGIRDTLSATPTPTSIPEIPLVDKEPMETYRNETMTALDDTLGKLSEIVEKGADVMKNWVPEFATYPLVPSVSFAIPWREQGVTIDFTNIPHRGAILTLFKFLICIFALVSSWKLVSWSLA